ncbi:DNA-binding protein [Cryobacterium sp. Hh11]|uniref:DNA-binding protein n=1 Tax=Cryobacterium levicorallinum TaxID=995038 RepID=A0A4R8VWA5_9MICO|nr:MULTISPECIES: MGMT family protein [Cryobacterium]TFB88001.1 DNA-binding protein [Cryobacterium levicorallinum]TFD49253.1 DNA-binding protein [Cryobacterium sp. Hh11]
MSLVSGPEDFVSRVLGVVDSIPPGRVMTYGGVAAQLGSRAARAVGQVMARYGSDVAWWRVIRASGHPPIGHAAQALPHYEAEHTPLLRSAAASTIEADAAYRVDYRAARWSPPT